MVNPHRLNKAAVEPQSAASLSLSILTCLLPVCLLHSMALQFDGPMQAL